MDIASGRGRELHTHHTQRALRRLIAQGDVETVHEKVLFDPSARRFVVGCWLMGRCPQCASACAGYFCEACGAHFRPEEVIEPRCRQPVQKLEVREIASLFLKVRQPERLFSTYAAIGVQADAQVICRRYLAAQRNRFRLTVPGTWEIPWEPDGFGTPRMIFQAGWEFLTYGELYGDLCGTGVQALDPASGVVCVASFGIDNTIPLLVGAIAGPLAIGDVRTVDHVLLNHFYLLEGDKFSTSRGHALWAGDAAGVAQGASDALRYHLCHQNPERQPADFRLAAFVEAAARLREAMWGSVASALRRWNAAGCPRQVEEYLVDRCAAVLQAQNEALDFERFSLSDAVRALDDWIDLPSLLPPLQGQGAYWWLKGVALLAYPIMPRFARLLWQQLGYSGEPSAHAFLAAPPADAGVPANPFAPFTVEMLRNRIPSFAA